MLERDRLASPPQLIVHARCWLHELAGLFSSKMALTCVANGRHKR